MWGETVLGLDGFLVIWGETIAHIPQRDKTASLSVSGGQFIQFLSAEL